MRHVSNHMRLFVFLNFVLHLLFCAATTQLHIQCEETEQHVTAKVSFSVQPEINLRCRLRTDEVSCL